MVPSCQLIVPLFVRFLYKDLKPAVGMVNVLKDPTVKALLSTPLGHVLLALMISIPGPLIDP